MRMEVKKLGSKVCFIALDARGPYPCPQTTLFALFFSTLGKKYESGTTGLSVHGLLRELAKSVTVSQYYARTNQRGVQSLLFM